MRIHASAAMAIAACLVALHGTGYAAATIIAEGSFDATGFRDLNAADRLNLVTAAIEARDRAMRNFDCLVDETTTNRDKDTGKERVVGIVNCEMRRLDGTLWIRRIEKNVNTGKPKHDSVCNWDGTTARGVAFPPYEGVPFAECAITGVEPRSFAAESMNELFGIRLAIAPTAPTLNDWLKELVQSKQPVSAETESLDGADMILLRCEFHGRKWSFWLDPARGFMIVRRLYQLGATKNRSTFEVQSTAQVSGVWVPMRATRLQELEISEETSEIRYEVRFYKVGTLRPADVAVDFPPDCRVMDDVHKLVYRTQPGGKVRLMALADVNAQKLMVPPEQSVVAAVDANTPKLYTKQPLVLATSKMLRPTDKGSPMFRVAAITASVLALCVVLLLWGRRRLRSRATG